MMCVDIKMHGRIILKLKMIFKKNSERVWNGFIWLRKGFRYTHLGTRSRTSMLHKKEGIS